MHSDDYKENLKKLLAGKLGDPFADIIKQLGTPAYTVQVNWAQPVMLSEIHTYIQANINLSVFQN